MKIIRSIKKLFARPVGKRSVHYPGALPNVLILGFPKCGTHALLHNLGTHPDIHFSPDEFDYFGNPRKSLEEYTSLFRADSLFNLEKSPYYVLNEQAVRHIAEMRRDAKLIVCLRHPVQFAHSFYNFRVLEHEAGYQPAFDPIRFSFENIVLEDLDVTGFNIEQGCYFKHIETNLLPHFSRQQVYFVIQERMHSKMQSEMKNVFEYLDLDSQNLSFGEKLRQHDAGFRYPRIAYDTDRYRVALEKLISLYAPWNEKLYDFLGTDIPEWKPFDDMYRSLLDSG